MNLYQFIASVIDSLAWPIVVFGILLVLRNKISALIPYVERMQYKDFSLYFKNSVNELSENSNELLEKSEESSNEPGPKELRDHLYNLAEMAPRAAVLEAWLNLEAWAKNRLIRQGYPQNQVVAMPPYRIGKLLESEKILSHENIEVFNKLRELRNRAVHVGDIDFPAEVGEYVSLSLALATAIRASAHPAHQSSPNKALQADG